MLFDLISLRAYHAKMFAKFAQLQKSISHPLWQWLYADSKFQLKELRIAIVAILVALGSAIGMQIMVKSFSDTLNAHLEKQ